VRREEGGERGGGEDEIFLSRLGGEQTRLREKEETRGRKMKDRVEKEKFKRRIRRGNEEDEKGRWGGEKMIKEEDEEGR
jgi:hypothetical protein